MVFLGKNVFRSIEKQAETSRVKTLLKRFNMQKRKSVTNDHSINSNTILPGVHHDRSLIEPAVENTSGA